MSKRLSFDPARKAAWGNSMVANPAFREMTRGLGETRPMVEMCTHLATERAGVVTLHLREGAPQLYPDHKIEYCLFLHTFSGEASAISLIESYKFFFLGSFIPKKDPGQ